MAKTAKAKIIGLLSAKAAKKLAASCKDLMKRYLKLKDEKEAGDKEIAALRDADEKLAAEINEIMADIEKL